MINELTFILLHGLGRAVVFAGGFFSSCFVEKYTKTCLQFKINLLVLRCEYFPTAVLLFDCGMFLM